MVVDADQEQVRVTFYGRLDRILECTLGNEEWWGNYREQTLLLAVITPSVTGNRDATKEFTTYRQTTAQIVTDLRVVQCSVGRAKTRDEWGILDRSGEISRTEFVPSDFVGREEGQDDDFGE